MIPATSATGVPDSIVNVGEFLSDHWLAEAFPTKLQSLAKEWKAREEAGDESTPKALAGAATGFNQLRLDLPRPSDPSYGATVTAMNAVLLEAAGFDPAPQTLTTFHGDSQVDIALLVRAQAGGGEMLHVLQARPVDSGDELLSGDAHLVEPIRQDPHKDKPTLIESVADAITLLFLVDAADSPRWVLVAAGPWLLLTDASRWSEGRYLAFDIDTALARRDLRPTGELAWHAGLWSADVLLPPTSGEAARIDQFSDDSVKHAVGVSADLREGLRRSVEIIANEALAKRRAAGLPVEGIDELPAEITTQTLRFLYRILFLLFAEARPELGILPVGAPEYGAGYGIDRLRELIQVPLSPQAAAGSHLHDSLDVLFELVNTGHGHTGADGASDGLVFEPLQADLFSPDACTHIDSIRLSNATLQKVLELLLLSKQSTAKNKQRGYVSYAQLGINQLGAVYEGLMAYTGFIAAEDLVELAKDGDPAKGTWMVPVEKAGDYDEKHLVLRPNDSGALEKVVHKQGTFVYRLAGRDRQRSASYYTPEILTRTVVKHALAELITDETTAADLLEYRLCEPALGSGAFANEAINQLAAEYLQRRQKETDETIDPASWQEELQKVKAWIALHRVYGVDLNATAVELAEVSMWLNVMYPGLQAPWFGLHLRRGNSLIGARRGTYDLKSTTLRKTWHKTPPRDRHLADGPIGAKEVHHFLLPAAGWGAAGDAKEAKELAPARAEALRTWSRSMRRTLTAADTNRLIGLANRVERLWALTQRRLQISEHEIARTIDVWNDPNPVAGGGVSRAEVESALFDPDSPYQRLHLAMDAWCALFFWPVTDDTPKPPALDEWLTALEALLGIHGKQSATAGQTGLHDLPDDFHALGQLDEDEAAWYAMKSPTELIASTPWLATARAIGEREGFFHWELDFAQIFARGGFDLIVGNPPWVRPTWQEGPVLAEADATLGLVELKSMDKVDYRRRRETALEGDRNRGAYLAALTSNTGIAWAVADPAYYPQLAGASNLYRNFILLGGRLQNVGGITGLLHPDDHLMHDKSADLREWIYPRLRRRWAFINEMQLFDEPSHTEEFGISVYGGPSRPVHFLQCYGLYHPSTLEGSLTHDGSGPVPAFQLPTGGWDLRPHKSRIVTVGESVLAQWAAIIEPPKTPALRTRALNPVVQEVADALAVLARRGTRMTGKYQWTRCWDEDVIKRADGYATWSPSQPTRPDELVLQPPHFSILTPFAKQPGTDAVVNSGFASIDLDEIHADFLPRTNYTLRPEVMAGGRDSRYYRDIRKWDGVPVTDFWRLAWRRRLGQNMARTLHAALIPPGPAHVEPVHTLHMLGSIRETALVAGAWATLPYDFLVKTMNIGDLLTGVVDHFAVVDEEAVQRPILVRVLRLNALTRPYGVLLEEVWDPSMSAEDWTEVFAHLPPIAIREPRWGPEFALTSDESRRAALVELDALVALGLGLGGDQLSAIYNSTFPVLRKYESGTWFDDAGHLIAAHHQQAGRRQQKGDYEHLLGYVEGTGDHGDLLERYRPPFRKADREAEMRAAYAKFKDRLGL